MFAGGKQLSGAIEMDVLQSVQQSYLTQLWSNDAFSKDSNLGIKNLVDTLSKYFTYIILAIAFLAGVYWFFTDKSLVFHVVSSVLIIACPCALALSAPVALGNMLRIFGKRKFYLTINISDATRFHYSHKKAMQLNFGINIKEM